MNSDRRIGWYVQNLMNGDISVESVNQDIAVLAKYDDYEAIDELSEAIMIFEGF